MKKKLKRVGFFRELEHGDASGLSLKASIAPTPQENEAEIVEYLDNGVICVVCMGMAKDVLDPAVDYIGSPHIRTDGIWSWPSDLAYYVEKYHARVPEDFVAHMKANNWRVPDESKIDLSEISTTDD